jgi:hypothetical protein
VLSQPRQLRSIQAAMSKMLSVDFIRLLPIDLSNKVLSFLSASDLCHAAATCSLWFDRIVNQENATWKALCLRVWGQDHINQFIELKDQPAAVWRNVYKK